MFRFSNNDKWTCQWKKKRLWNETYTALHKTWGDEISLWRHQHEFFLCDNRKLNSLGKEESLYTGPAPDRPAGLSIHAPLSTPQDIFRRGTWYWAQHIFSGGTNDQQPSSAHSRLELCPKPLRWSLTHHSFLYLYKISYAYVSFCTISFSVTLP